MNEIELKPCPFCGGKATLHTVDTDDGNWVVECEECRCTTPWCADNGIAAQKWNRRADNAKRAELPHLPLELLGLSVKPYHCLKRAGMDTVKDVVKKLGEGGTHIRNLGEKGAREVAAKFKKYGVDIKVVKDSGYFCLKLDGKGDDNG